MTKLEAIVRQLALNELGLMESVAKHSLRNLRGNADLLVADYDPGFIGSSGVLLDRRTGRVHILGSAYPIATYLWAIERGFRLDDDNVLLITAVRDEEATIEVLKHGFKAPYVRDEVAPQFKNLPLRIEVEDYACWLMLGALQKTDAFTFEVNP